MFRIDILQYEHPFIRILYQTHRNSVVVCKEHGLFNDTCICDKVHIGVVN